MRWRHPVFVCLILALILVAAASEAAGVSVRDAWVRETPSGVVMMAGYMALRNNTSRPQAVPVSRLRRFTEPSSRTAWRVWNTRR
jgi:copper(I)-binding protein